MNLPAPTPENQYTYGLTESAVRRLQEIIRKDCGVELSLAATWSRAIELMALAETILEALPEKSRDFQDSGRFALPPP